MDSGPNKIVEAIVGRLIPPACREEILGDMRQRHQSSVSYLLEGAHTIPCIIYSRICRTTDALVAVAEGFSMLTAFVVAAGWLDPAAIVEQGGLVRFAIPPLIFLVAVILADAYADPKKRWPLRPLFGPLLGFTLAYIAQSVMDNWALQSSLFAWGCAISVVLLSTLRLTFPPLPDRPQAANAPAFWQKLELSPSSIKLESVLLPGAILVVVILYLLQR